MTPLVITASSLVCAAGQGLEQVAQAVAEGTTGLRPNDLDWIGLETHIGRVDGIEDRPILGELGEYDCRNNRLAEMGLASDGFDVAVENACSRYGRNRIALILGTSTSGIRQSEIAYENRNPETGALPTDFRIPQTHEYFSLADYVRRRLGVEGPTAVVSTACSSSSKAFADAYKMIVGGACDAAVVGGVDSLCRMTAYGFASLELLAAGPCRPNDVNRAGISIGEAAGFALLEKSELVEYPDGVFARFLGYGESSDGFHMSSPDPEGLGARLAMETALLYSNLTHGQIDYVNLHGTGTKLNDRVEDAAIHAVFGDRVPCGSTKGWTGHPLGAAGITGILLSGLAIRDGLLPQNLNVEKVDPEFKSNILTKTQNSAPRYIMANAFGFGGSNCSIVLGAPE